MPLKTNRFLAGFVVIRLISYPAVQHLKGLCLVTWVSPETLSTEPAQRRVEYTLVEGPLLWEGEERQAGLLSQVFPGAAGVRACLWGGSWLHVCGPSYLRLVPAALGD